MPKIFAAALSLLLFCSFYAEASFTSSRNSTSGNYSVTWNDVALGGSPLQFNIPVEAMPSFKLTEQRLNSGVAATAMRSHQRQHKASPLQTKRAANIYTS